MAYSHSQVKRRFERGETTGKGHNMHIETHNDWTLLVGYGHAVYAAQSPEGDIVTFLGWKNKAVSGNSGGWRGGGRSWAGSTSTKQHPVPTGDGVTLVAYRGGSTAMEQAHRDRADIVTGVDRFAAPQLSDDWLGIARDALTEAHGGAGVERDFWD